MKLQESAENYLETIFFLEKKLNRVRSIDIANELNYSKPSVSIAMKNLKNNEYIEIDKDGFILLTEKGLNVAKKMYERHVLLSKWLISLGVNPDIATEDACRIEHVISSESFEAIKKSIS